MTKYTSIIHLAITVMFTWRCNLKFFNLSPNVEGVLGRTYQPDFKNPAKAGVSTPVVGGEDKYRTASLLTSDSHANF